MSAFTALVATGNVLLSMILSVSVCRLWIFSERSTTNALNLLNVAMRHASHRLSVRHQPGFRIAHDAHAASWRMPEMLHHLPQQIGIGTALLSAFRRLLHLHLRRRLHDGVRHVHLMLFLLVRQLLAPQIGRAHV